MLKIINEFFRILWLSVSSTGFYSDLYSKYKGYGLKYISMIISVTSIIYAILFMYNMITIRNYLEPGAEQDNNPVEFMLKNWPILQYDGKTLSSENPAPVYITTQSGVKLAVIDVAGTLSKDELQKVSIVFAKDKLILWLGGDSKNSTKELSSGVLTYDKIFGAASLTIDRDFIKSFMFDELKYIGPLSFCLGLPLLILLRLAIHVSRNLFSIALLYVILWWMRKAPNVKAVSRVIFFSSGVTEFVTPFVLIIYPPLAPITVFIEYWAVMLAMYAIARSRNDPRQNK